MWVIYDMETQMPEVRGPCTSGYSGEVEDYTVRIGVPFTTSTSTSTSTTTTVPGECPTKGDAPPCGIVTLSEVVSLINQWAGGQASLSDVIKLINMWKA
jgi:hypothetical protein